MLEIPLMVLSKQLTLYVTLLILNMDTNNGKTRLQSLAMIQLLLLS